MRSTDRPPACSLVDGSRVTVTADGRSRVYTLQLIPADIETGTVGGTVPPTLGLTLGFDLFRNPSR